MFQVSRKDAYFVSISSSFMFRIKESTTRNAAHTWRETTISQWFMGGMDKEFTQVWSYIFCPSSRTELGLPLHI